MLVYMYLHAFVTDYQIVIICSNDAKDKRSYIMDHLQFFHRGINVEDQMICKYLNYHLKNNGAFEYEKEILATNVEISASVVDPDKLV